MHRLIREMKTLWGGGRDGGGDFIRGLSFKEMRTPNDFREGKKSWHRKASWGLGAALWEQGRGAGCRVAPTWTSASRGAPVSWAPEASPTSPSHLISKQRVTPSTPHHIRAKGAPPQPPWGGSSSHSRTRKHCCFTRWF